MTKLKQKNIIRILLGEGVVYTFVYMALAPIFLLSQELPAVYTFLTVGFPVSFGIVVILTCLGFVPPKMQNFFARPAAAKLACLLGWLPYFYFLYQGTIWLLFTFTSTELAYPIEDTLLLILSGGFCLGITIFLYQEKHLLGGTFFALISLAVLSWQVLIFNDACAEKDLCYVGEQVKNCFAKDTESCKVSSQTCLAHNGKWDCFSHRCQF